MKQVQILENFIIKNHYFLLHYFLEACRIVTKQPQDY